VRPSTLALCATLVLLVPATVRAQSSSQEDGIRKRRHVWPAPALGASRSGSPEVLFTFDDGPQTGITDKILDALGERGIKAVFFVVGHRLKPSRPKGHAMVRRMLEEQHVIGNHTTNHVDLCLRENRERIEAEIDDAARALSGLSEMPVTLFRAPYGARCAALERALADRGLDHLHWDIDPQDWKWRDAGRTAGAIVQKLRTLRDDQRAVVLIHDTKQSSARVVPEILDWLDGENRRRTESGRRTIRVLHPADVALEWLAPGVAPALDHASEVIFDFLPDLQRRIFGPFGPSFAKVDL
jgi:peptidoglycan-N-acetylglucosamine deacetylase